MLNSILLKIFVTALFLVVTFFIIKSSSKLRKVRFTKTEKIGLVGTVWIGLLFIANYAFDLKLFGISSYKPVGNVVAWIILSAALWAALLCYHWIVQDDEKTDNTTDSKDSSLD